MCRSLVVVEEVERSFDAVAAKDVDGRGADLCVTEFHRNADFTSCLGSVGEAQVERQGSEHADARISDELDNCRYITSSRVTWWSVLYAPFIFVLLV